MPPAIQKLQTLAGFREVLVLYQKRPSESVQTRDVSRGAPDTALRLLRINR